MAEREGTIELTRVQGGRRDLLRSYTVLIDEVPAGKIGRGQTLRLTVPEGPHQLRLKIDWCSSPAVTADVDAGTLTCFTCAPGKSFVFVAVTFGAKHYISLWPAAADAAGPDGGGPRR
jgi:hypothetical protein